MKVFAGERAVIFGGGHCGQALVPILASVGFCVTVCDDRPDPRLLQPFCANPNHLRRNTYRNFLRCYSSNIQANGRMYASDRLLRYAGPK